MSSTSSKIILLIDYENIQNLDFSSIQLEEMEVKIFVGQSQNKIPFELVQSAQTLGSKLEWIKIEGSGNNSLDFHIAFHLGVFNQYMHNTSFLVLSKDKGFDPLINYLKKQNWQCRRIEELANVRQNKASQNVNKSVKSLISKVINNLSKINKNSRPKTKITFRQYIKSLLRPEQVNEKQLDLIIETLFVQNKLSEVNQRLVYNF